MEKSKYKDLEEELEELEEKLNGVHLQEIAKGKKPGRMTGFASKDKPWLKYYVDGVTCVSVPEGSIYENVKKNNSKRLDKVALELRSSANNYDKGIEITYGTYFNRIDKIAKSYHEMGLKPDELLVTILPNVPESRMLIYGLNAIGVTVYPVSPMISSSQLDSIINENDVKNVVCFSALYPKFESVLKNKNLDSLLYVTGMESTPKILQIINNIKNKKSGITLPDNKKLILWDEFERIGKSYRGELIPYYADDHVAIVVGTSGTTGVPKGVCLSDYSLNAIAVQHGMSGILSEEDIMLDALIQSIAYGISTMHYSTFYGYKNILIPELLTTRFPEVLCKTKPDHFTGGPVHCQYLAASKEFANNEIPRLRNLVSGGATLPKELEKILNGVDEGYIESEGNKQILIRQGFGATENGGCGAYAKPGSYKFGSVGIPLPFDTIAIFEPNTDKELPYGEEGEICISGPTVMKGYLNNEEETKKVLLKHSDGKVWLHLADLGWMDKDGCLYITDRIKNIFMRNGFNVHPSKIEEFINTIPYVKESKVIGFDHPEQQKVPVAFISLVEDTKGYSEDEILDLIKYSCYENLEEMSIPYDWRILPELPHNLGGKIDQNILINQSGINYVKKGNENVKEMVK